MHFLSLLFLSHTLAIALALPGSLISLYIGETPLSLALFSLSVFCKKGLDFKLNISFILVSSRIRA